MIRADGTLRHPREAPPSGRTIVRLRGALDIDAAPALRERLIDVLHRGAGLLVLDLSRVLSCDASGLAVLIGTQRRARLLGIMVRLAAPSLPVTKVLRSTGLDRSFTIYPDLSGALASELDEPATPASAPPVPAVAGQRSPLVPELAAVRVPAAGFPRGTGFPAIPSRPVANALA
jgi:anti-sigma B factor antagonist